MNPDGGSEVLDTVVAAFHALNACIVGRRGNKNLLLNVEVHELGLELLVDLISANRDLLVLLTLIDALAEDVGFECFFVGVLLHHALELERVGIK
jgi:hypothetical protein